MENVTKTCSKCSLLKSVKEFPKTKLSRDGLSSQCKVCAYAAISTYKAANRDKVRANTKTYYEKNKKKCVLLCSNCHRLRHHGQ